ncbi:MAG TPA: HAD hydrolase-like protein [Patescibacteria group bacterium]|jgi:putative hydrolase of the HAD superfamily|nr:HAD hydrolase-like protein [Patescibacteria group bacterium]
MLKAILYDADGMVINKPKRFSEFYTEQFNVPLEKLLPFFQKELDQIQAGKADLKVKLQPYLADWNWSRSVDELLEYWFKVENYIDQKLVESIALLRQNGIKCYLTTNQEKYRTQYLKNVMGMDKIFDGIFSSSSLGVLKPEPGYWEKVLSEIKVNKNEVLIWDDEQETIESAKKFGFNAELYTNFDDYKEKMTNFGI